MRTVLAAVTIIIAIPAFAQQPPSCNDEGVKQTILNRHFNGPRDRILSNVLIAQMMSTINNQNPVAWKANWLAQLKNVRQQRIDVENNKRVCVADLLSTGGPDADSSVANKLGVPLCVNHLVEYEIQTTEDTHQPYISSRCGAQAVEEEGD